MGGWLILIILYIILLLSGVAGAIAYRKLIVLRGRKRFDEFMRMRAFLHTQLIALIKAYDEIFKVVETNSNQGAKKISIKAANTFAQDIKSNIAILNAELDEIKVPPSLDRVKEAMLRIIDRLEKHINSLSNVKNIEGIFEVIEDNSIKKNTEEFKYINQKIQEFMEDKNIDENDYFYQGQHLYI